ncbi:MAG: Uracil-DNA glycosylase [Solivirus sp.]|uniref:Uracil-DNA glycosylase n=1 Tax=Solivirus sp. TaxID=2487772 RepID=A0A3G5AJG1_9VIRU|nr:MAG: Uracil-DNA glycosylase [Solivirus sp.]
MQESLQNSATSSEVEKEKSDVIFVPIRSRLTITEKTTIQEIGLNMAPLGWESVFAKCSDEFQQIQINIDSLAASGALSQGLSGNVYYPQKKDLFRAFDLCPLNKVRVVILGQDPYHASENGVPQANGLSFSTNRGCRIQPSLMNIFKELKSEYPNFEIPNHGDLTNWALFGILMLNACLTVSPSLAGSHKSIWNGFIGRVLEAISAVNPTCIFLLWGAKAQFWVKKIGQKSIKLLASHPSPFSAHKGNRDSAAFLGCNCFKLANEELKKIGSPEIDWCKLD